MKWCTLTNSIVLKPLPRAGEWHIAPKHVTRSPRPRTAAGAGLRAMGVQFGIFGSDKTAKSSTSSAEVLEHGASFDTRHGGGLSREA